MQVRLQTAHQTASRLIGRDPWYLHKVWRYVGIGYYGYCPRMSMELQQKIAQVDCACQRPSICGRNEWPGCKCSKICSFGSWLSLNMSSIHEWYLLSPLEHRTQLLLSGLYRCLLVFTMYWHSVMQRSLLPFYFYLGLKTCYRYSFGTRCEASQWRKLCKEIWWRQWFDHISYIREVLFKG